MQFMIEEDKAVFMALLLLFILNFAILDSLTTHIALNNNCYESNFLLANLNIDLVKAKLLGCSFIILTAIWLYSKDKQLAKTTMLVLVSFSFGIVLNNILNILGGFS